MFWLARTVAAGTVAVGLLGAALFFQSIAAAVAALLALGVGAWCWRRARVSLRPAAAPRPDEKQIYEKVWAIPGYRSVAPGEQAAQIFLRVASPERGAEIVDLGCGTGRGSAQLATTGGLRVTMVDFARNCLDPSVQSMLDAGQASMRFVEADLTKALPVSATYGFCTDVMEHIPPEKVDDVLENCLRAARKVFFQICTVEDSFGEVVGFPLHLTVQPYEWWLAQFRRRGCTVHWSESQGVNALFYVSAPA